MRTTTLAIDAATARLTVALRADGRTSELHLDGPRRHATEILAMIDALLGEHQLAPREVTDVVTGDGPGSFTGLRVASAVAKALVWGRPDIRWYTAPSLLARAVAQLTDDSTEATTVLALSDALRGELFAGCWRFAAGAVQRIGPSPRAVVPEMLAELAPVDLVVGTVPEALLDQVRQATGREVITGDAALPSAAALLRLMDWQGGVAAVADSAAWQPDYGRPAEAQAVWERKFGRRLPDPTYHAG